MSNWKLCADSETKDYEDVGMVLISCIECTNRGEIIPIVMEAFYDDGWKLPCTWEPVEERYTNQGSSLNVIAWMPLPKPYKETADETN